MRFVSDNDPAQILAFDLDGTRLDWVELPGADLNGIAFHDDGSLYYVDAAANQVVRLEL